MCVIGDDNVAVNMDDVCHEARQIINCAWLLSVGIRNKALQV